MSNADIFQSYLDRFTSGNVEGAADLLDDSFTFHGPMVQANDKAEFLASTGGLVPIARGYEMHRVWVDGDEVCAIYDFQIETPAGSGSIPMAEWSVIRGGKLVSSRLLFDTAAFAALMPASE
jgi:predicted SnoaL-like aldol condensation-catalyzing enzyme